MCAKQLVSVARSLRPKICEDRKGRSTDTHISVDREMEGEKRCFGWWAWYWWWFKVKSFLKQEGVGVDVRASQCNNIYGCLTWHRWFVSLYLSLCLSLSHCRCVCVFEQVLEVLQKFCTSPPLLHLPSFSKILVEQKKSSIFWQAIVKPIMNGCTSLKLLLISMIKNNMMVASYALKLNKN